MNKVDVHLSNEHPDMKMNFNTLQYFHALEHNDVNNGQNALLLSCSNIENNWLGVLFAIN